MEAAHCKDRQTFLARLRQSNLLPMEDFASLAGQLPETDKAAIVARFLVERGALTRFQAEMLMAGRTSGFVLGQYRILDEIGRGGMGRVFKAMHATMHRLVAIKVLSSKFQEERGAKLFRREVRRRQLVHPHMSLPTTRSRRRPALWSWVCGRAEPGAVGARARTAVRRAGMSSLAGRTRLCNSRPGGMVHRDIKPANLCARLRAGRRAVAP